MSSTDQLRVDEQAVERYNDDQGNAIAIRSLDDISRISKIFVQSGMFKADKHGDAATKLYQAGVKIIAGVEFGIQPFAAMRGINIINGNAEMSANLMAAKVKGHPKYDYRVKQWDRKGCVLEFFEILKPGDPKDKWDKLGESSFDEEDARQADLIGGNWKKFARNMYFARAISNGVRIHCPDVFYGAPVYTDGEISGEFDQKPQQAVEVPSEQPKAIAEGEVVETVDEAVDEQPPQDVADQPVDTDQEQALAPSEPVEPPMVDELNELKREAFKELNETGRTKEVQQKAFVQSVISKSKIETVEEANDVLEALRIEREEHEESFPPADN